VNKLGMKVRHGERSDPNVPLPPFSVMKNNRKIMTVNADAGSDGDEIGLSFVKVEGLFDSEKIKICKVSVDDLHKVAFHLASVVQDSSWINALDRRAQRAYRDTAAQTANKLVDIFNNANDEEGIGKELGELVVSMGSAKGLNEIFSHYIVPLAELWKPQLSGNEGYDFHTVCGQNYINFGEAKFKSSGSAYASAMNQVEGFVAERKHRRDAVPLENMVSEAAMDNLDHDEFGLVFAFSMNTKNPLQIMINAVGKLTKIFDVNEFKVFYLVGVEH